MIIIKNEYLGNVATNNRVQTVSQSKSDIKLQSNIAIMMISFLIYSLGMGF